MKTKLTVNKTKLVPFGCFMVTLGLTGIVPQPTFAQTAGNVTYIWPLTFTADKVTPIGAKPIEKSKTIETEKTTGAGDTKATETVKETEKTEGDESGTLAQFIEGLNGAYGTKDDKPIKNIKGRFLVISGKPETVLNIRRHLTTFDTQWPQVQLDMWAVQITGSPQEISKKGINLQERFIRAREAMTIAKNELLRAASFKSVRWDDPTNPDDDKLMASLTDVGFDTRVNRRVSLTEALAFIALQPNPQEAIKDMQGKLVDSLTKAGLLDVLSSKCKPNGVADSTKLFRQLSASLPDNDRLAKGTINDFATGLLDVKNAFKVLDATKDDANKALNQLPQKSSALDLLLQAGMDAFTEDMQEMFLRPILADIQKGGSQGELSGIALSGKTRQVVSNNLESKLDPEMSFSVNTTRPAPIPIADLLAATAGGAGTLGIVKKLISSQPEPEMTTVSPGISIHVVPNILKNGSAARLQMAVKIAVATTEDTVSNSANRLKSIPADAIKGHNIQTDAVISGFDLFDISSFSIETSHPRSRYLPIIGSIPLLGELIKRPRKNKVVHQESMIFVNAAILPRAMSLAQNYGN